MTNDEVRAVGEVLITFDLPLAEKISLEESLALVAKQGYQRLLVDGGDCAIGRGGGAGAQFEI